MDSLRPKQARPAIGRPDHHEVSSQLSANPQRPASGSPHPAEVKPLSLKPLGVEAASSPAGKLSTGQSGSPLWMRRLSLVVFVTFCVELGLLLAILPWTRMWNENGLLLNHQVLRDVLQHNFFRGAVSGLGLVDVWLGISEAVRYREAKV